VTDKYFPEPPTEEYSQEYLYRELTRISILLEALLDGNINISYTPPERPRDGMKRYADGAQWNPGLGRGLYWYDGVSEEWVPYG